MACAHGRKCVSNSWQNDGTGRCRGKCAQTFRPPTDVTSPCNDGPWRETTRECPSASRLESRVNGDSTMNNCCQTLTLMQHTLHRDGVLSEERHLAQSSVFRAVPTVRQDAPDCWNRQKPSRPSYHARLYQLRAAPLLRLPHSATPASAEDLGACSGDISGSYRKCYKVMDWTATIPCSVLAAPGSIVLRVAQASIRCLARRSLSDVPLMLSPPSKIHRPSLPLTDFLEQCARTTMRCRM
ncbi:hypothetical protein FB567DRAFT_214666 [Paraphoma chrysanthemicola]|uniref:Uncharacterized protein n=1 Tax=Paraphoma chrysanthemicola TaxID=798071 RepID=A0A8K0QV55_9PLEO|nr:hypothetical protein FB567DRAFT_214666 [Paraphoma chrysanthemicola]